MPCTPTTYIRLLNLCAFHKADLLSLSGLMAVNALVAQDFEQLRYWSEISQIELQRQAA